MKNAEQKAVQWNENEFFTYKELNRLSQNIASNIIRYEGEEVLLRFRNKHLAIACILGVLRTGKSYIPLDGGVSKESKRDSFILNATDSTLCITDYDEPLLSGKDRVNLIKVDTILESSEDSYISKVTKNSYAYTLFTSGTTGNS